MAPAALPARISANPQEVSVGKGEGIFHGVGDGDVLSGCCPPPASGAWPPHFVFGAYAPRGCTETPVAPTSRQFLGVVCPVVVMPVSGPVRTV